MVKMCNWGPCSSETLPVVASGKRFCSFEHLACWAVKQALSVNAPITTISAEKLVSDSMSSLIKKLTRPDQHEEEH